MHVGRGVGLELEFDLLGDVLELRTTDGRTRQVPLEPRSVASFYRATMAALGELDVSARIAARPNEIIAAIPFARDEQHRAYDADAVRLYWHQILNAHRVMHDFRGRFIGKSSPVHFFWGASDLAVTRFSGRRAPKHHGGAPNCADWVMELAYRHEVSSAGFWPGAGEEGAFYSYAYPEPAGYAYWPVVPDAVYYDKQLGEFILPYTAVRRAADPDATLLAFLQSTYEAAAVTGNWDRAALEV
jgi:hypothetical protein